MRTLILARARNHALLVACLGLTACGGAPGDSRARVFEPNSVYDPEGDGIPNGIYLDTNRDGISDGIDTDKDGIIDKDVYGQPFKSGDGDDEPSGDGDEPVANGDGDCEEQIVRNDRLAPDMLIVLDRSGSMKNNNTNRWDPSVMALKTVTAQLGGGISFGLMSFPHGDNQCAAGEVDVPIAINNGAAISTALTNMQPEGGTPTSISLAAAHKILGGPISSDPDARDKSKYVLLVTDGEPNCLDAHKCDSLQPTVPFWDPMFGAQFEAYANCIGGGDAQAIVDTVAEIKAMAKDGIKTYVVGYDTSSGGIKTTMDSFAAAGGTGEKTHIAVKSGSELVKALEDIAGKAASCTVTLVEAVSDPSYVLVTIDEDTRLILDQPDGNGFAVAADNRTVTIQGTSCDTLRAGVEHQVHVQVLCEPPLF